MCPRWCDLQKRDNPDLVLLVVARDRFLPDFLAKRLAVQEELPFPAVIEVIEVACHVQPASPIEDSVVKVHPALDLAMHGGQVRAVILDRIN